MRIVLTSTFDEDYTFSIATKLSLQNWDAVRGLEYIQGKEPSRFTGTAHHQYFTSSNAANSLAS